MPLFAVWRHAGWPSGRWGGVSLIYQIHSCPPLWRNQSAIYDCVNTRRTSYLFAYMRFRNQWANACVRAAQLAVHYSYLLFFCSQYQGTWNHTQNMQTSHPVFINVYTVIPSSSYKMQVCVKRNARLWMQFHITCGSLHIVICPPIAWGIMLVRGNAILEPRVCLWGIADNSVWQNTTYDVFLKSTGRAPTGQMHFFAKHVLHHTLHCTRGTVVFNSHSPLYILLCIFGPNNICPRLCVIHAYETLCVGTPTSLFGACHTQRV